MWFGLATNLFYHNTLYFVNHATRCTHILNIVNMLYTPCHMQACHSSLFDPPLPMWKLQAMNSLECGVVNKIVLDFTGKHYSPPSTPGQSQSSNNHTDHSTTDHHPAHSLGDHKGTSGRTNYVDGGK